MRRPRNGHPESPWWPSAGARSAVPARELLSFVRLERRSASTGSLNERGLQISHREKFGFAAAQGRCVRSLAGAAHGHHRLQTTDWGKTSTEGNEGMPSARRRWVRPRRSRSHNHLDCNPLRTLRKCLTFPVRLWEDVRCNAGIIATEQEKAAWSREDASTLRSMATAEDARPP